MHKAEIQHSAIIAADGASTTKYVPLPQGGRIYAVKLKFSGTLNCSPVLVDGYVAFLRGESYEGDLHLFTTWYSEDAGGHNAKSAGWMGNLPLAKSFRPFLVIAIQNDTGTDTPFDIFYEVEP